MYMYKGAVLPLRYMLRRIENPDAWETMRLLITIGEQKWILHIWMNLIGKWNTFYNRKMDCWQAATYGNG
jgi:hypothetical protein